MTVQLAPSILAADFLNLSADVEVVNANADIFHLDIMDGIFVPNISFGFPVVDAIAVKATKPLDVHLMIARPWLYFERFAKSGASMISFHLETAIKEKKDIHGLLNDLKSLGVRAGLAINPDVPVEELFPYLQKVDFLLLMSVFAGFGGQKFIPESTMRISALRRELIHRGLPDVHVEVDGGIGLHNAKETVRAGADILVAGSSIFGAEDPSAACKEFKSLFSDLEAVNNF